jgi:hypothetical protein
MTQVQLGQIVTTAGVAEWIDGSQPQSIEIARAVWRHRSRDWGDICREDWTANDEALRGGGRLHSSYKVGGREIWIITESDRSVTTVLFPEEY